MSQAETANDIAELYARLNFAGRTIEQLDREVQDWERKAVVTRQPNAILAVPPYTLEAKIAEPIPLEFRARIGTSINDIRVILDGLATVLAARNGNAGGKSVYFPISETEVAFEKDGRKKLKELSTSDAAVIRSLQPFATNDQSLYRLHKLDITRKHYQLAAHAGSIGEFRAEFDDPNEEYEFSQLMINGRYILNTRTSWGRGILQFLNVQLASDRFQTICEYDEPTTRFTGISASLCFKADLYAVPTAAMPQLHHFVALVRGVLDHF